LPHLSAKHSTAPFQGWLCHVSVLGKTPLSSTAKTPRSEVIPTLFWVVPRALKNQVRLRFISKRLNL
jgi:hypothetical protein